MDERYLKPFLDPKVTGALVGFLCFGLGAGVGYILGRRQQQYSHVIPPQDWTLADLASVPDDKEVDVEVEINVPEEVVERGASFIQGVVSNNSDPLEVIDAEPDPTRQSIFVNVDENDPWNQEAENAKRTETEPYILHKEEFWAIERDYTQTTLTYYAGDDILVDEEDAPIYNFGTIVGELKFGHGSGDQNTFYVRNDKLRAEYEIIKDGGLYSVEVLGLEIEENARANELKHSGDRKFRQD